MIKIKEEELEEIVYKLENSDLMKNESEFKQILQDHEDANQCREFHYREHQATKDRQIVT